MADYGNLTTETILVVVITSIRVWRAEYKCSTLIIKVLFAICALVVQYFLEFGLPTVWQRTYAFREPDT